MTLAAHTVPNLWRKRHNMVKPRNHTDVKICTGLIFAWPKSIHLHKGNWNIRSSGIYCLMCDLLLLPSTPLRPIRLKSCVSQNLPDSYKIETQKLSDENFKQNTLTFKKTHYFFGLDIFYFPRKKSKSCREILGNSAPWPLLIQPPTRWTPTNYTWGCNPYKKGERIPVTSLYAI